MTVVDFWCKCAKYQAKNLMALNLLVSQSLCSARRHILRKFVCIVRRTMKHIGDVQKRGLSHHTRQSLALCSEPEAVFWFFHQ